MNDLFLKNKRNKKLIRIIVEKEYVLKINS